MQTFRLRPYLTPAAAILIPLIFITAASADTPLFSNSRFTFYDNRLVSNDKYVGTWRSTDGMSIIKDGDPAHGTWNRPANDKLYLQTPYPILDAAFSLAIRESLDLIAPAGTKSAQLMGDSPGGTYYYPYYYFTKGTDIREYTSDTAQHVEWGDSVILTPDVVKGTMLRRCDFSEKLIREDKVTTADSVALITSIWEYYKITGDAAFLSTVWDCLWNAMHLKETALKKEDGLWTGSPWSDNQTGFLKNEHFINRNTAVESLYANTVAAEAWASLANIATTLGKASEASECNSKYTDLKTAINNVLYRPEFNNYCYYKYKTDGTYYDYREDITAGMLYLYGIADSAKALAYHKAFTATNYGYRNIDPVLSNSRETFNGMTTVGEATYHGGNVWENEEAYHAWLMSKLHMSAELKNFIFWHARAGLLLEKWQEGTINPTTGELHRNYTHMLWGGLGYTATWTRGVFGINYDTDGIAFEPCVPDDFGNDFYAVLNNFTYRKSHLRIALVGKGTVLDHITLDGKTVILVPATIEGPHNVVIYMSGNSDPTLPAPRLGSPR